MLCKLLIFTQQCLEHLCISRHIVLPCAFELLHQNPKCEWDRVQATILLLMDIYLSAVLLYQNCSAMNSLCTYVDIFLEKLKMRNGIVGALGGHL